MGLGSDRVGREEQEVGAVQEWRPAEIGGHSRKLYGNQPEHSGGHLAA